MSALGPKEKHEPASDIDTAVVDGLKALDPNRPIREADIASISPDVRFTPKNGHQLSALWSAPLGLDSFMRRFDSLPGVVVLELCWT